MGILSHRFHSDPFLLVGTSYIHNIIIIIVYSFKKLKAFYTLMIQKGNGGAARLYTLLRCDEMGIFCNLFMNDMHGGDLFGYPVIANELKSCSWDTAGD